MVTEMDRILNIWDEELSSIVEIEKIGHRRRILLSVAGPTALQKRGDMRKSEKKVDPISSAVPKCEAHRKKSPPSEETRTSKSTKHEVKRLSASGSDLGLGSSERRYTSTSSASEGSSKPPTPSRTRKNLSESGNVGAGTGTLTLGRRKKKAPPPPAATAGGQQPAKEDLQVSPKLRAKSSETANKPVKSQTELKKCSKHASSHVSQKAQEELPEVVDIPPPLAFSCSFQVDLPFFISISDLSPLIGDVPRECSCEGFPRH